MLEHGEPGEATTPTGRTSCRSRTWSSAYSTGRDESLVEYVPDRPGHDRRYSLAFDKLRELGWEPEVRFEDGVPQTIDWNCDNEWWWWARSGAASTASATCGNTAERPAVRRRYGVTSNRLLNGFSSGSFSQLEKPASCVSSLAFAGGSPQVPSPAPPFASDVVMQ
jgi:hypothetical protein